MTKNSSYSRLLLSLFAVMFVGVGCTQPEIETAPIEQSESGATVEESVDTIVQPDFGVTGFFSSDAKEVEIVDLDLNVDGVFEKLVTYTRYSVDFGFAGISDTVHYLRVYYFDNGWHIIKEDQKNESMTPGHDGKFCQADVVRFSNVPSFDWSKKDYLLVRKCHLGSGDEGYYLFGYGAAGPWGFGEIEIAKAYVHPELYLKPDDRDLTLLEVEAVSDGLIEHYGVNCTAPENTRAAFCAMLKVKQTFDSAGFMAPIVVK
ncbi:MAG: hypothetical protein AAB865_02285 [Patescibacteria group bacterium]